MSCLESRNFLFGLDLGLFAVSDMVSYASS